eukprot:COSAG01_NODE_3990_length_5458_cov_2.452323_5_plen_30_part_00
MSVATQAKSGLSEIAGNVVFNGAAQRLVL